MNLETARRGVIAMRTKPRSKRSTRRNRQLLAMTLLIAPAVGCKVAGGKRAPFAAHRSGDTVAAVESQKAMAVEASQPTKSHPISTVGYDEGIVTAAPRTDVLMDAEGDGQAISGDGQVEVTSDTANVENIAPGIPTAETPQPVDYFVDLALARHPSILAARQRVAAEVNRIPQVRALPDPMLNNTFWPIRDQALQTAGGRIGHQMSLSQAVPWPEKLRTRAAIASREVQIAQAEVDRIEREITESVRLAYYEVWYATRALAITEETRALVEDLIQITEARYRSGGTQQDVLRAQLEMDRLDDQTVTLQRQKEVAQADLAALVQQPVSLLPEAQQVLALTDVPGRLEQLIASAEQCSPEIRALVWEIQRDRQRQRLADLQRYPDLQFGVNWALVDDDTNVISPVANGHDNLSFTVGTSLPIWRNKIDAGIREAASRTSSTAQRLQAARDALYGRLRRLLAQADALVEQRDIYEERIIPRTEDTLRLTIADYRGERTDFFTLIETYRELLVFETQLARIDATLAGTVAQIERAVGCPRQ